VKEITERCGGEYGIAFEGRRLGVNVRVSSGAAEHRPGESSTELFRRADKFLYRAKESAGEPGCEKEPSL
jgi:PleD family two-component response regulator